MSSSFNSELSLHGTRRQQTNLWTGQDALAKIDITILTMFVLYVDVRIYM